MDQTSCRPSTYLQLLFYHLLPTVINAIETAGAWTHELLVVVTTRVKWEDLTAGRVNLDLYARCDIEPPNLDGQGWLSELDSNGVALSVGPELPMIGGTARLLGLSCIRNENSYGSGSSGWSTLSRRKYPSTAPMLLSANSPTLQPKPLVGRTTPRSVL